MEFLLLDSKLRINVTYGLDKEAVRPVPDHWDKQADVLAIVGDSEKDDLTLNQLRCTT